MSTAPFLEIIPRCGKEETICQSCCRFSRWQNGNDFCLICSYLYFLTFYSEHDYFSNKKNKSYHWYLHRIFHYGLEESNPTSRAGIADPLNPGRPPRQSPPLCPEQPWWNLCFSQHSVLSTHYPLTQVGVRDETYLPALLNKTNQTKHKILLPGIKI